MMTELVNVYSTGIDRVSVDRLVDGLRQSFWPGGEARAGTSCWDTEH